MNREELARDAKIFKAQGEVVASLALAFLSQLPDLEYRISDESSGRCLISVLKVSLEAAKYVEIRVHHSRPPYDRYASEKPEIDLYLMDSSLSKRVDGPLLDEKHYKEKEGKDLTEFIGEVISTVAAWAGICPSTSNPTEKHQEFVNKLLEKLEYRDIREAEKEGLIYHRYLVGMNMDSTTIDVDGVRGRSVYIEVTHPRNAAFKSLVYVCGGDVLYNDDGTKAVWNETDVKEFPAEENNIDQIVSLVNKWANLRQEKKEGK